jgi:hypothetical protein
MPLGDWERRARAPCTSGTRLPPASLQATRLCAGACESPRYGRKTASSHASPKTPGHRGACCRLFSRRRSQPPRPRAARSYRAARQPAQGMGGRTGRTLPESSVGPVYPAAYDNVCRPFARPRKCRAHPADHRANSHSAPLAGRGAFTPSAPGLLDHSWLRRLVVSCGREWSCRWARGRRRPSPVGVPGGMRPRLVGRIAGRAGVRSLRLRR